MDRCALFVDAGYVLADGAMAVHGTRRRQSVSWDYGGLLQLLSDLAVERTGLPLLRCYWYENAASGAELETLADIPGIKLRCVEPGSGPDGVEGEMRRDLTTLARNHAVTDAMVVSSAEELTHVVADVQDHGMRVTLLHLAADGNGTVSRALRQECDDIVEISAAHLRPYVELISGAEPPQGEDEGMGREDPRLYANGRAGGPGSGYPPVPTRTSNGHSVPAYTESASGGHQRPVPRLSPPAQGDQAPPVPAAPAAYAPSPVPAAPAAPAEPFAEPPAGANDGRTRDGQPPSVPSAVPPSAGKHTSGGGDLLAGLAAMPVKQPSVTETRQEIALQEPGPARDQQPSARPARHGASEARQEPPALQEPSVWEELPRRQDQPAVQGDLPARREFTAYQDLFAAPVAEAPPSPRLTPRTPAELAASELPPSVDPAPPAPPPPAASGHASGHASGQTARDEMPADLYVSRPHPADLSGYTPGAMRDQGWVTRDEETLDQQAGQADVQPVQPSDQDAPVSVFTPLRNNGSSSGPEPAVSPRQHGTGPLPASAGPPAPAHHGLEQRGPGQEYGQGYDRPEYGQPVYGQHAEYAVPGYGQADFSHLDYDQAARAGQAGTGTGTAPAPGTDPLGMSGPVPANVPANPEAPGPAGPAGPAHSTTPAANGHGTGGVALQPVPEFAPATPQPAISLPDAVQSAHDEGQEFGGSVARDAPALWLEAVLARKPRMPSDLEARLLQGSSLPIDYLLHDEVRHALRRGFWDALERARR